MIDRVEVSIRFSLADELGRFRPDTRAIEAELRPLAMEWVQLFSARQEASVTPEAMAAEEQIELTLYRLVGRARELTAELGDQGFRVERLDLDAYAENVEVLSIELSV